MRRVIAAPKFRLSCTAINSQDCSKLLRWYDDHQRALPWRESRDPYRIWISEIMLQQTRAQVVAERFPRFLRRFPDVAALASASLGDVLKAWEGMGYYSRARNLHAAAGEIVTRYQGKVPKELEALRALPGIGEYTAAAIASQAFGIAVAAVDANVLRVLGRFLALPLLVETAAYRNAVRKTAQEWVNSSERPGDVNQALMELGALVCTSSPDCAACPLRETCGAFQAGEQGIIPRRKPKKSRPVERWRVALLFQEGRVLARCRREGLLQGLWEFLLLPEDSALQEALALRGLRLERAWPLFDKKHAFTHRIWELEGWAASVRGEAPEDFRFVDARELESLPFSSALAEYREAALRILREEVEE